MKRTIGLSWVLLALGFGSCGAENQEVTDCKDCEIHEDM